MNDPMQSSKALDRSLAFWNQKMAYIKKQQKQLTRQNLKKSEELFQSLLQSCV